jgi:hypothetical protein
MSQDSLSEILRIFRLSILQRMLEVYVSKLCKGCRAYQVVFRLTASGRVIEFEPGSWPAKTRVGSGF